MGRTREFDVDTAIEVAAKLFWEKGYEGTSLADLTGGMGINPPSFYIAFKSKAALFRLVLQRYREQYLGFAAQALEEKTARAVAERLLFGYADLLSSPDHPPGCLAMNSAWIADGDGIREELKEHREFRKKALRKRFQKAIAEDDLPVGTSAEALANYVMVVAWGMALEGQGGAGRRELRALARSAMNAWPSHSDSLAAPYTKRSRGAKHASVASVG
ncbi:TetR/AcrR family transcriptional regulator [Granulicella sp. dw_53]|uniref:TetR/AcrR family transcriptional regulator n=1 Tax=Granulicella sp. dw_53 TaxID=2719792 RepID=UPI001BD4A7C2|nr:TetR/AcrR family transcriptional regulator [Granulicella sp. dw_53]